MSKRTFKNLNFQHTHHWTVYLLDKLKWKEDTIVDSDGLGIIQVDGQALSTTTQQVESIFKSDSTGYTVVKVNGGNTLLSVKPVTLAVFL